VEGDRRDAREPTGNGRLALPSNRVGAEGRDRRGLDACIPQWGPDARALASADGVRAAVDRDDAETGVALGAALRPQQPSAFCEDEERARALNEQQFDRMASAQIDGMVRSGQLAEEQARNRFDSMVEQRFGGRDAAVTTFFRAWATAIEYAPDAPVVVEHLKDARVFIMKDQPKRLDALIAGFIDGVAAKAAAKAAATPRSDAPGRG